MLQLSHQGLRAYHETAHQLLWEGRRERLPEGENLAGGGGLSPAPTDELDLNNRYVCSSKKQNCNIA